jgi:hypothetical protein
MAADSERTVDIDPEDLDALYDDLGLSMNWLETVDEELRSFFANRGVDSREALNPRGELYGRDFTDVLNGGYASQGTYPERLVTLCLNRDHRTGEVTLDTERLDALIDCEQALQSYAEEVLHQWAQEADESKPPAKLSWQKKDKAIRTAMVCVLRDHGYSQNAVGNFLSTTTAKDYVHTANKFADGRAR